MKKKIVILIVAIITIINVVSAAFLFFDIQALKAPETTIKVEVLEVNSTEALIRTTVDIRNPNSFEMIIKNLELVIRVPKGENIAEVKIDGGVIPSNKNETFTKVFAVNFNGNTPETLETRITGTVGMKSGFIQKTMPISVNVITILDKIITDLLPPNINVHIDFGEISQKSVNITTVLEAYNPNSIDIGIKDILVSMTTETGASVGNFNLTGGTLAAESSLNLSGNGTITIETLNAKTIIVSMNAKVDATIANFTKTLPIFVKVTIGVPDLKTLLPSKFPTDIVLKGDFRVTLRGFVGDTTLEVYNHNKIEFVAKDITISIYRIDSNTKCLLGECTIEDSIIKAENTTILKGEMVIPYRKLFIPPPGGRFIPDWLEVYVRANITISGLNTYIWVGIIAYEDIHLLRIDKV